MIKKMILTAMLLFLHFPLFSETIILKSGKKIEGKIIEKSDDSIKVDIYGVPLTYYFENIESIDGEKHITPELTSSGFTQELSPKEIFKRYSPAVVYITTGKMMGSGFIIDKRGLIVTNYHVIAGAKDITIQLKNGETYKPTSVINYNILEDLCILNINVPHDLTSIPLGNSDNVDIGEDVVAIGNPQGLKYIISDGIISQKDEYLYRKYLNFTCPISQGSSGGPLLNMHGEAIGVTTMIYYSQERGPAVQNLNVAVAINEVRGLLDNKNEMTMQEFISETSELQDMALDIQQERDPVGRYNKLRTLLRSKCPYAESKNCFSIWMELIRTTNMMLAHYAPRFKEGEQVNFEALNNWVAEYLSLLKYIDGVEKAVKLYKLYFNPSEESIRRTIKYSFVEGYRWACFTLASGGDLEEARKYYNKYKEYITDPNSLLLLDTVIEKAEKHYNR